MNTVNPNNAVNSADIFIDEGNADLVNDPHPMRDAALALAEEGFRVFPLPTGQKRATLEKWPLLATADREQVSKFFPILEPTELLSSAEPNVAIVTGGELMVLDEDPRHGSEASIEALQAQYGQLPATRTVRTPSGGRHRYFRVPADRSVRNSTSKLGAGLDVRGDGGYVAAPPSTTDKGEYAWENQGAPIADAPQWLIDLATAPRAPREGADSSDTVAVSDQVLTAISDDDDWKRLGEALKFMRDKVSDNGTWAEVGYGLLSLQATRDVRATWYEFSRNAVGYEAGADVEWWDSHRGQQPRSDFRHIFTMAGKLGWQQPLRVASVDAFPVVPVEPAASAAPAPSVTGEPELQQSGRGQPLSNVFNAVIKLSTQKNLLVSYDEFSGKTFLRWPNDTAPRALIDEDFTRVQLELQRAGLQAATKATAIDAVRFVARENTFNAVRDYLNGLTWDKTRRLSLMMSRGFGTPSDRYHIRAGRNMLISMVARGLDPGCQVDEAIVLEGDQGLRKTSAFRIIGGPHFKELTAHPNSKDFEQQLQGAWLGEFAELNALRRPEDINRLKQFVTCREDHLRLPYDRVVSDLPRRTVLCGSTNEDSWLHDPTGGRRFIPVKVGAIDLAWLSTNRDQLFAEAVALYKAGRKWWVYPKAATLAEQEARAAEDPWTDAVRRYLCGRAEVDASDILNHVLQIPTERQTKAHSTRAGITLKRLGCKAQAMRRGAGGRRSRPWVVPAEFAGQILTVLGPVQFTPIESNFDLISGSAA